MTPNLMPSRAALQAPGCVIGKLVPVRRSMLKAALGPSDTGSDPPSSCFTENLIPDEKQTAKCKSRDDARPSLRRDQRQLESSGSPMPHIRALRANLTGRRFLPSVAQTSQPARTPRARIEPRPVGIG